jgi:hypothetical protein
MRGRFRKRTVAMWLIAIAAFLVFAYGESPAGQRRLASPTPAASGDQAADAFAADDRAMGDALAPIVYVLLPGLIAFAFGLAFAVTDVRQTVKDRTIMG